MAARDVWVCTGSSALAKLRCLLRTPASSPEALRLAPRLSGAFSHAPRLRQRPECVGIDGWATVGAAVMHLWHGSPIFVWKTGSHWISAPWTESVTDEFISIFFLWEREGKRERDRAMRLRPHLKRLFTPEVTDSPEIKEQQVHGHLTSFIAFWLLIFRNKKKNHVAHSYSKPYP